MRRLSIVIPCPVFNQDVEDTLVSVLQNRPPRCEIIVVTAGPYADPYHLAGDVTFVEAGKDCTLVELANLGIEVALGEIIHLLQPGARVVDGWTDRVLPHFDSPDVGAVSPAVVAAPQDETALWLGVGYWSCGVRRMLGRGRPLDGVHVHTPDVLGPAFCTGFYRRDVLAALGYFDARLSPSCADIDLALALQQLNKRTVVEPACRVVAELATAHPRPDFQIARHGERVFRRQASVGWGRRILHLLVVLAGAAGQFPHPRMLGILLGWLVGACESGQRQTHADRARRAEQRLAQSSSSEAISTLRIDFAPPREKSRGTSSSVHRRRAA